MCCQYFIRSSPELRPVIEALNRSPLLSRFPRGAAAFSRDPAVIRPTDAAPVIAFSRGGCRTVFPMKWGFGGPSLLINARVETAAEKPTFREAWKSHRCVIPASGYYEWEHRAGEDGKKKAGRKFMLRPADSSVTWLCGLYRMEDGLPCYVILTREPAENIRFIHDRMPLMLPEEAADAWIRPDADPAEIIRAARTDIRYEPA